MAIRKLPPLLVNQIAAGEVIERPASVVKELVENSLDAGARAIDVTIEEGGTQLIRIRDDGAGIPEDDLPLALAPHATSKLADPSDLDAIGTLGFRGEALASIASVSRLRLTSRATINGRPCEAGHVIEATGAQVSAMQPAGVAPGTVVEVRDLFFNTPARRKFLRSPSTEFGHITDTLTRIAMAWPSVAFKLIHNERVTLDVPAEDSPRRRCIALLGHDIEEALLEFGDESPTPLASSPSPFPHSPAAVWGLAGLPAIARGSAKAQYLFLNGRPIRDRNVTHALREAYRGLLPPDRQPLAVVMLHVDARAVDVNVHPTKAEVRFREPSRIHGLVLNTIRQRLLAGDLTPHLEPLAASRSDPFAATPSLPDSPAIHTTDDFVNYFRRMDPTQKGFVYQQVRDALAEEDPDAFAPALPASVGSAPTPGSPDTPLSTGVIQVHDSYLVTQDEHGILIVDQHALHERVMFEELRHRVLAQPLESQRLLMPATLPASERRIALLEPLGELLARIGIEAAPIGPASIAIHAFPTFLFDRKVDPAGFLGELLDRAEEGEFDADHAHADEAVLHKVLDMMACKAAVKAGDRLTSAELQSLLDRRAEIERSSNCPHGRPTTIRLTIRDLEKHFQRT